MKALSVAKPSCVILERFKYLYGAHRAPYDGDGPKSRKLI